MNTITKIILISSFALVSACSRNNVSPGEVPAPPPPAKVGQVKSSLGAVQQMAMAEDSQLIKSGPRYDRVKKIMDRLGKAAGMGGYKYPVFIADNADPDTANAFIQGGTTVVAYSALLEKIKSDDELAGVLAHETGHMLGRHQEDNGEEERAENVSLFSRLFGMASAVGVARYTNSGAVGRMAGGLAKDATAYVGEGAFVKAYSRDMEREADTIGLTLMAKAGYDPRAAVQFWRRANQVFGESSKSAFMSTHPSHEDRADDLEEQLDVALTFYKGKATKLSKY